MRACAHSPNAFHATAHSTCRPMLDTVHMAMSNRTPKSGRVGPRPGKTTRWGERGAQKRHHEQTCQSSCGGFGPQKGCRPQSKIARAHAQSLRAVTNYSVNSNSHVTCRLKCEWAHAIPHTTRDSKLTRPTDPAAVTAACVPQPNATTTSTTTRGELQAVWAGPAVCPCQPSRPPTSPDWRSVHSPSSPPRPFPLRPQRTTGAARAGPPETPAPPRGPPCRRPAAWSGAPSRARCAAWRRPPRRACGRGRAGTSAATWAASRPCPWPPARSCAAPSCCCAGAQCRPAGCPVRAVVISEGGGWGGARWGQDRRRGGGQRVLPSVRIRPGLCMAPYIHVRTFAGC